MARQHPIERRNDNVDVVSSSCRDDADQRADDAVNEPWMMKIVRSTRPMHGVRRSRCRLLSVTTSPAPRRC